MILWLVIVLAASLLASGILFRHQRVLTLVAGAGALFEAAWLLITLVQRVVFTASHSDMVLLLGSLVWLTLWLPQWRRWHWPYRSAGSGWRDVAALTVLVPTLVSAWFIQRANGLIDTDWVAHSYYNGDTAALLSLVSRSFVTPGLVSENPFAGNGSLEYPTLIHAGLAEFIAALGGGYDWLHYLPLVVLVQVCIIVPLFFLLRDVVKTLPPWGDHYRWGWRGLLLEAGVIGYVLGLSWESYVYPQGHFFTTTLFMLVIALLARAWPLQGRSQYIWTGIAGAIAALLLLSNAVTGTAAFVSWTAFALLRGFDRKRLTPERIIYFASIAALLVVFQFVLPSDGGMQVMPTFSYTAAGNMALVGVPLLLLFFVVVPQLRHQSFIGLSVSMLALLAVITFVFSSREIIVDNASRFFYHALLIGWPLGVDGIVRVARVGHARFRQADPLLLRLAAGAALVTGLFIVFLPMGASVASVHDHLLFKDVQVSPLSTRLAMEWIITNTDPRSIFVASPEEPWEVPLFTGRALLRTNYWLSPDDALQVRVNQAFAGDAAAQAEVVAAADYVLLKAHEVSQWNLPADQRVYNFGAIAIYAQE